MFFVYKKEFLQFFSRRMKYNFGNKKMLFCCCGILFSLLASSGIHGFLIVPPTSTITNLSTNDNNTSSWLRVSGEQRLFSIAGSNLQSRCLASVDVYSLTSNNHLPANSVPPTPQPVFGFGSVVNQADNNLYVVGGLTNADQDVSSFWSYPLGSVGSPWNTALPPFPYPVSDLRLLGNLGDGLIYALGGYSSTGGGELHSVFTFSPTTRTWTKLPQPLPEYNRWPCAVVANNGQSIFYMANSNLYRSDDRAQTWKRLKSEPRVDHRQDAACVNVADQKILVAGGSSDSTKSISDVAVYYIEAQAWKTEAPLTFGRTGARAVSLNDGSASPNVLVCGGSDGNDQVYYQTCEIYNWQSNTWSVAGYTLDQPRAFFGLVLQSF